MYENLRKVLDFDDLLFEKRNRDYGAYQLRKRYNSVLIASIFLAVFLVSSALVLPFIITPDSDRVFNGGVRYVQVQMENLETPIEEIFIPPPPPPPSSASSQEVVKYVPPVVVDTVLPLEVQQITADEAMLQVEGNELGNIGVVNGTGDDILTGQEGMSTDDAFFMVEVMPAFRGGDINKFREWVQKRTNYPQIAIDNKIQGRVYLTFIIEPNGDVSNVTVVKGVDPIIDIEAVKAIKASPKWSPGLQRGQPVRVRFSMWLSFVF
jgi:protein TonB